jgi:hypothetical protein
VSTRSKGEKSNGKSSRPTSKAYPPTPAPKKFFEPDLVSEGGRSGFNPPNSGYGPTTPGHSAPVTPGYGATGSKAQVCNDVADLLASFKQILDSEPDLLDGMFFYIIFPRHLLITPSDSYSRGICPWSGRRCTSRSLWQSQPFSGDDPNCLVGRRRPHQDPPKPSPRIPVCGLQHGARASHTNALCDAYTCGPGRPRVWCPSHRVREQLRVRQSRETRRAGYQRTSPQVPCFEPDARGVLDWDDAPCQFGIQLRPAYLS